MLEITPNTHFNINKNVTIKNILNQTYFMLDSTTGTQYNLTEVEYIILTQISEGKNIEEVNGAIIKDYDVDKNESMNDLLNYIKSLYKENLITVSQ